ncbi:glycosyltransferase family 4 protein [Ornithinimicrobium sp. W1665]|uniref:glycosyltransferase family 4 protein n=1 Tax=Ornithinimicrobium sp. W1665 TaxID=3416666 RepID=UPI003CE990D2
MSAGAQPRPPAGARERPLRALVLTVVHHPQDARIRHRQVRALLEAGWEVTYVAPWAGHDVEPERGVPGLRCVDVERAVGRSRWRAQRAARSLLRHLGPAHDVVLLHDPELVPTTTGLRLPPVVWDVHEDTPAAISVRPWVPDRVRPALSWAVRGVERLAERRMLLLLADDRYADRFRRSHPVVPNATTVPQDVPPAGREVEGVRRVVYLGSVTLERGARELVDVGRGLREKTGGSVRLEVLGPAHGPARELMADADRRDVLDWRGFVANPAALARIDGALAGLSLLHDEANFRPSMPTKVVEYLAHGVPVVTTPLPVAADLVRRSGGGVVVPFGDTEAVLRVLLGWADRPARAVELGAAGHRYAADHLDWRRQAALFVDLLQHVARTGSLPVVGPGAPTEGA